MRMIDQLLALGILLVGVIHVWAGFGVFARPSEDGTWFLSAGLLGITAGLANLARAYDREPHVFGVIAAVAGSASVLLVGLLLALTDPSMLRSPASVTVLALGAGSLFFGARDLMQRR